jgi:hypothetical protein
MFKFGIIDEFLGLWPPISIDESIQPPNLIGGSIVVASVVIADDLNEGSNDDNESLEGYDINFYFWSKWIIHNC